MRLGPVFLTAKGTGLDQERAQGSRRSQGRLDLSTEES